MDIETIRLRRAALGCVLEALPKWKKSGVRIANHVYPRERRAPRMAHHLPEGWIAGALGAFSRVQDDRPDFCRARSDKNDGVSPALSREVNALFHDARRQ